MRAKDKLILDMQNMKWYICSIVNEEKDHFKQWMEARLNLGLEIEVDPVSEPE